MEQMIYEIIEFVANILKTHNTLMEKGILFYIYASNLII